MSVIRFHSRAVPGPEGPALEEVTVTERGQEIAQVTAEPTFPAVVAALQAASEMVAAMHAVAAHLPTGPHPAVVEEG